MQNAVESYDKDVRKRLDAIREEARKTVWVMLGKNDLDLYYPGAFTKIIRLVVEVCGVSQTDISVATDMSLAAVGKWMKGSCPPTGYRQSIIDRIRPLLA